jgi:predicted metalloprotease
VKLKRLRRRRGGIIDRRGHPGSGTGMGFPGFPSGRGGGDGGFPSGGGFPIGKGGIGVGTVVLLLLVVLVLPRCFGSGGGLGDILGGSLDGFGDVGTVQPAPAGPGVDPTDPTGAFVDAVADDVQYVWDDIFTRAGETYEPTRIVLFTGSTSSACGRASSATGPFYCPADRLVYLDASFFDELERRFGASGDFAEAYVIAHEIAHHVQTLLGINGRVQQQQRDDPSLANELSVRLELQADCFAGVWGRSAQSAGILEPGDVEEGLNAASAIGDDRIQESVNGRIDPESFTHGTAEQRATWLRTGIQVGNPDACDTFSIPYDEL